MTNTVDPTVPQAPPLPTVPSVDPLLPDAMPPSGDVGQGAGDSTPMPQQPQEQPDQEGDPLVPQQPDEGPIPEMPR